MILDQYTSVSNAQPSGVRCTTRYGELYLRLLLRVAEREQPADCDQLGLSEHTVKNYLFHVFEKLGVSNQFELLFLLSKECSGSTADRATVTLATEQERPIETYLTAAEEGSVAAQLVVGLAHLDSVEKSGLSASIARK